MGTLHTAVRWLTRLGVPQIALYRLGVARTVACGLLSPSYIKGVLLEVSTGCNRKCWYCPHSVEEDQEVHVMPREVLEAAVAQIRRRRFLGTVDIGWYNEPMLRWDDLLGALRHVYEQIPGAFIRLYSNGDFLDAEKLRALLDSGLSYLYITLHNNSEERRRKILADVPPGHEGKVRVDLFREMPVFNRSGHPVEGALPEPRFCTLQFDPVIRWNGDIHLCCNDFYGDARLGNVLRDDFWQVWRRGWKRRVRILFGHWDNPACYACKNLTRQRLFDATKKAPGTANT